MSTGTGDELGPLTGLVENHEQKLYGLRYTTTAWRLGGGRSVPRGARLLAVGRGGEAGKTVRYELKFEKRDANTIHYWEDTVMQVKGLDEPFHHTDENTLTRVS